MAGEAQSGRQKPKNAAILEAVLAKDGDFFTSQDGDSCNFHKPEWGMFMWISVDLCGFDQPKEEFSP